MNRLLLKRKLLFIGLFITITMTAWSQVSFKNGIKQGQIKVKFKPEMTTSLNQVRVNARTSGFTTGIQALDETAKSTKASNMVRLFPYDAKFEAKLQKHGLHLWYVISIDETVDPKTAVAQFRQLKEVAAAEVEHEKVIAPYDVKPYVPTSSALGVLPFNDPLLKDQWHYDNTGQVGLGDADANIFEAWQTTTGANNIIVSVHDQGVDVKHVDLKANIWINEDEVAGNGVDDDLNGYVDDINGYNFQSNKGAVDAQNHGTHVAGTIAAVNNNGIGVSGIAGGNGSGNGVKIMTLQILGGAPIENSYVYAANNGAVISQNSWGYTSPDYVDQSVLDAIDYFVAEAGDYQGSPMRGGLVLFAAGNNDYDAHWYPAYHPSTMAVASIGPEWKKAAYSNFGAWVEISAPGGDQQNAYGSKGGVLSTIPKDLYAYMQGTSMACPHMSGVAALALSNRNAQMTNTQLWNKLATGVVNIDKYNTEYIGKLGSGAIDAALAIKIDQGNAPLSISNLTATDIAQEFAKLTWTVPSDPDDAQPLKFTIHYSTQPLTAANLAATAEATIKNDSIAGKTVGYEVQGLLGLTHYYFAVTSTDRWGNISPISNVLEFTTNDGPAIAVTPTTIGGTSQFSPTWIIDAAVSKTGTKGITIQNNAAGLLRYTSLMRSRANVVSTTSVGEDVIYPVAPASSGAMTVKVGRAGSEDDGIVKLYSNEPVASAYTPITKKLYSGVVTNLIGETDTSLPNSAAGKFTVTEAGGFNLTQVKITLKLTRAATATEPIIVEIYNGNGPSKENRLLAQAYTTSSLTQFTPTITLNEQLYFAQGESFWVVFHVPNANLFPLGIGYDIDQVNYSTECYYSSNVGATWMKLDEALNDKHFAWGMEAFSGNADFGTFLSLAPASGDISGLNSSNAVITADANNLINGNYTANLVIPSNDALNPETRVPVYLKVQNHQPNVKMIDIVDFNSVFVSAKKSFDIVMDNQGYGKLASMTAAGSYVISGAGASQFIIEGTKPSFVNARDQAIVRVSYVPTVSGVANATLTITGKSGSNTSYTYTVSLFGVGAETSKIAVTPDTQSKTPLAIGESTSATVTVQNTGAFPLKYFIPGFDTKGVSDNWPSAYHKYGYRFRTNFATDPNPIAYTFQNIKTTGIDITSSILTDRTYHTIDIGFDFPYYGKAMKTIYVAQKGFTTFDNSMRPLNTPPLVLGTASRPGGYISVLGTFLTFSATGKVYYKREADRLIIQYDNVSDGFNPGTMTAQMVLYTNGDIRFFYDNMGWNTTSQQYLNILIEDLDKTDGIIIHNTNKKLLLANQTALGFDYPGPNIITGITNGSGIVAPGASATVTVNMNTATLTEGVTNRYLNIISNDPANAQKTPLIQLDITSGGTAQSSVSTNAIAFGNVFQGAVRSQVFTIKNNGTANVNITSMTFTSGKFTIIGDAAPFAVKPGLYKEFQVVIPTTTVETLEDDLVITYADATTATIHVTGNVVPAPAITTDLASVAQVLNYKETASVPYSVENTGAAPLEVSVTGKQWVTFEVPGSTPTSVTYDVEKHNTGGVYQWIDVRKTGVHLDFSGDVFSKEGFWEQIDLPFPFEFYGTTYNKIQLGLNGVASFEMDPPVMYFADSIPSKGYDGAHIMPYWTFGGFSDFVMPAEDIGIFYQNYDDKIIITWSALVNNFGGMGDPISAQMFLYKNGTIKFQYRVENTNNGGDQTSNFTVIGLQKGSTQGITISPRTALDYGSSTGLAYIMTPEKKHTVAAGTILTGDLNFNSHNVYGGVYNANLKVKSNAPGIELQTKPVQLTVNGTPVYVAPDSIKYGQVMIANPTFKQLTYEITNTGSAPLVITNMKKQSGGNTQRMSFAAWVYAYNPFPPVGWNWQFADVTGLFCTGCANTPISVGANETLKMMVEHNPNAGQNYNEGLIVTSNARIDTIRFTSTAYRAPGLVITPTAINESMNSLSESISHKIPFSATNTNNGQGNLNYSLAIEFGRVVTASTEAMATSETSAVSLNSVPAEKGGVTSSSAADYNRVKTHTDKTLPDTWVGTGGSSPFVVATKYNSGTDGFSLSHVETFVRFEDLTSAKVHVEIRAGGTSPATASKVTEGSYEYTGSSSDGFGSWLVIPMDKVGNIYPNEDFYVIVTTPLGVPLPQGTISDVTTTGNRYYYYDYDQSLWFDINTFSGFETLGWLTFAAEKTAGITSWLSITSSMNGSNAPGVLDTVRLTVDSHYGMRGDQIANIVMTTNDPLKKVTKIPVSLHVNEAPKFNDVPEVVMVAENATSTITIPVIDKENNSFTVAPSETYAGLTYNLADGKLSIEMKPDYGTAGNYSIKFTATDEHGAISEMTYPVVVAHTNRAPAFIGEQSLSFNPTGEFIEFHIDDFFADPDNDQFTYSVTSGNTDLMGVFVSGDVFLINPTHTGETTLNLSATDMHGATQTASVSVVMNIILSAEDGPLGQGVKVYPNPMENHVSFEFTPEWKGDITLKITDVEGRTILVHQVDGSRLEKTDLNVSGLKRGIYVLRASSRAKTASIKLIKK
jgi:subtilisin family serine protease